MRYLVAIICTLLLTQLSFAAPRNTVKTPAPEREWTFLIFLNGFNNLDSAGHGDMNEMEAVGSTEDVNVVVQWGSYRNGDVRRVLVQKDSDPDKVNSPVIETVQSDMGDWKQLVEFVRWGAEKFPAKHYFVDVWDHGSGWHLQQAKLKALGLGGSVVKPTDISWDDRTGNSIKTEELGEAMRQAAKFIGHKVDIYGSDACLMAMMEVADEMSDAVNVFVGSQELEPGPGWPYADFLAKWTPNPKASAREISKMLVDTYVASYKNGSQGKSEVTLSSVDLDQIDAMNAAIADLRTQIGKLNSFDLLKASNAASDAFSFYYSDYRDLMDFVKKLESKVKFQDKDLFTRLHTSWSQFLIANGVTSQFADAQGISIWLPSRDSFDSHIQRYNGLRFNAHTSWGSAAEQLLSE